MCGIIGVAASRETPEREWLTRGRDAMTHRGPDDAGEWWSPDGRVGLGHRRLSILDLSPAGHQPMHGADGVLSIVFNGEIYNFKELRARLAAEGARFVSQSDTEVLLAAYRSWGVECLSQLNGMFAFALYDASRKVVLLARDRVGEKPLFYRHVNGTLRFASELKGLLADGSLERRIDHQALDCLLAVGYVPGDLSILQSFNKLPPAHAMEFSLATGQARVWRYWQLPTLDQATEPGQLDERVLLDELEVLLEDSVRRQLVADVPVGVLLSGGVDSSLITALAARASKKLKTFTVHFPGFDAHNEHEHARLIARHFATDHIELEARPTSADVLPRLARQFDEPIIDSSMIPTFLVSQLVRQHCTVALGGDGGDELFGGYLHYSRFLELSPQLEKIPRAVRHGLSLAAEHLLPVGLRGRNWLQTLGSELEDGLPSVASHFDRSARRRIMRGQPGWSPVAESILRARQPQQADLLQRVTRMDFDNYLPEDILVKVDRASMLNSLEVRAPLLDHRVIEFAFARVPGRLKATQNAKKILLKRLAVRVLPPEFDRKRKHGFSIPLPAWLKDGAFREMFHDVLLSSESIFDRRAVRRLLRGQDWGFSNSERLFGLVLVELWRREYSLSI
jgi:asparagine synthase (glutamine-hydrolysing)